MILDEAFKYAEELADYDCYNEKQLKCAEEYRQLAEWLKELKQLREQTRWIPVSERLPKEIGTYEVTLQGVGELKGIDNEVAYATWLGNRESLTLYDYSNWLYHDVDDWKDKEVIAWKPLSMPYKAESEDNK